MIASESQTALKRLQSSIDEAGYEFCFPLPLIYALISRLSVENGSLVSLQAGWTQCRQLRYRLVQTGPYAHFSRQLSGSFCFESLVMIHYFSGERCYGVMQIPESMNPVRFGPESMEHIGEAVTIIIDLIDQVRLKLPHLDSEQLTRRGIAAYDAGVNRVLSRGRRKVQIFWRINYRL